MVLHLSVTAVRPAIDLNLNSSRIEPVDEQYLLQLQPAKPLVGVSTAGEVALREAMDAMSRLAGRVEGVKWEVGGA